MDMRAAGAECSGSPLLRSQCKACGMAVMLHCSGCQIQVTGCACLAIERYGVQEARKMLGGDVVDKALRWQQDQEEKAKDEASRAGLWVPGRNS